MILTDLIWYCSLRLGDVQDLEFQARVNLQTAGGAAGD
jgi:hypothetical protein